MTPEEAIVGRKIIGVREMTQEEMDELMWYSSCLILILEGGIEIFASKDPEGNDAGDLWICEEGEFKP